MRVTASTSRHPERDCLVLWLGLTAGMRVTEIAQIEVQDVLFPSGALRSEIILRMALYSFIKWTANFLWFGVPVDAYYVHFFESDNGHDEVKLSIY